jgi:hypothetical protein
MIYAIGGIATAVLYVTGHRKAAQVVGGITLAALAVWLVMLLAYMLGGPR